MDMVISDIYASSVEFPLIHADAWALSFRNILMQKYKPIVENLYVPVT